MATCESPQTRRLKYKTSNEFYSLFAVEDVALPMSSGIVSGAAEITCVSDVPVAPKQRYMFTVKVRVVEIPKGCVWEHMLDAQVTYRLLNDREKTFKIGKMMHVCCDDGWVEVGGDFSTSGRAKSMSFSVHASDPSTKFEMDSDSVRLLKILPNPKWRDEANERIDKLRKGKITIKFTLGETFKDGSMQFRVEQVRSSFPFGSAVGAGSLKGSREIDAKYRENLFKYFNWATPANDVKWRIMENKEGQPNFENGDKILEILEAEEFKVRGHCLMWARIRKIASWLVDQSAEKVSENVDRRLAYVAEHWGDRFSHWDVNNEMLHDAWYSEKLQQANFLSETFKKFHALAPNVQLFVNDFAVFSKGMFTMAYKQQVLRLQNQGAPIGGIGLQSHFGNADDMEALDMRLNILGQTGVPLWLTEFDCGVDDDMDRADFTEDLFRLAFSHPNMQGIVVWGFWNQNDKKATLMTGEDFQLTSTGERLHKLWKEEWWTSESLPVPEGSRCHEEITMTTRAFHGSYRIIAEHDGRSVWSKRVELGQNEDLVIYVDLK